MNTLIVFIKKNRRIIEQGSLFAIYATITLISVLRHEPVPDEAQYWVMARDAGSLIELHRLTPWAAHPFLWMNILFFLSRLGFSIMASAILNWVIMISAIAIFLFKVPFFRSLKYAFIFSFYIFYEYVVFARNYGIATLILFIIAWLYPKRFVRPLFYGFLILLLFGSHYMMFPVALALAAIYLWEMVALGLVSKKTITSLLMMATGGIFTFFSAFSLADVLQNIFLPKEHWAYANPFTAHPGLIQMVISRAFVPINDDFSIFAGFIFGLTILAVFIVSIIKKRTLLFSFLFCLISFLFIFVVIAPTLQNRHFAFILMTLVFFLWISFFYKDEEYRSLKMQWINRIQTLRLRKISMFILAAILMFSVKIAIRGHRSEWNNVLSGGRDMAFFVQEILEKQGDRKDIVVAFPITNVLPFVAAMPKNAVWSLERQEPATFFKSTAKDLEMTNMTGIEVVARAKEQFHDLSRILLVVDRPLPFDQALGYRFLLLKAVFSNETGYMGTYPHLLYKPIPIRP